VETDVTISRSGVSAVFKQDDVTVPRHVEGALDIGKFTATVGAQMVGLGRGRKSQACEEWNCEDENEMGFLHAVPVRVSCPET
jgi:hypothetical protein